MKDEYEITGGERGRYLVTRRSTATAGERAPINQWVPTGSAPAPAPSAYSSSDPPAARIVQLVSHQGRLYALRSDGSVALAWIDHNPQTPMVRWATMVVDPG